MRTRARPVVLVGTGLLLLQLAWIVAVPPFGGMDEPDHAFRAAGVAAGQWRLSEMSPDERGLAVVVPSSLTAAAARQCEVRPDVTPAICQGEPLPGGRRVVATTAGAYHPLFYWAVGTPGRVVEGAGSLYAMRAVSAALCLLFLVLGFAGLAAARAGPAVWLGALVGVTPTLVYSSVVVAPNGLEMAAGFALWAGLLFLGGARAGQSRTLESAVIALAVAAAVTVVTVRALGPLWVVMIAATVLALSGTAPLVALTRRRPAAVATAVALVGVATVAAVGWTLRSGLASSATAPSDAPSLMATGSGGLESAYLQAPVHVWVLQAIAAFPYRDQIPVPAIHLCVLLVLVTLLAFAVHRGRPRQRTTLVLAVVVSVAVPVALALATEGTGAAEWQGRYALPFLVGLPVIAGWVLQDVPWRSRFGVAPMTVLALTALAVAQVWSVGWVQLTAVHDRVLGADPDWVHGPLALTVGAAVLGSLLMSSSVAAVRRDD